MTHLGANMPAIIYKEMSIMFVIRTVNGVKQVLMFRKKNNSNIDVGAGMLVPPGGKLNDDETSLENARRETFDETGVFVNNPIQYVGEIWVHNAPYSKHTHCHVQCYLSHDFCGELKLNEPDKGTPQWVNICNLPYDDDKKMIHTDVHWMPRMLNGEAVYMEIRYNPATDSVNISEKTIEGA
jgi:8-oxo-dGTP pyrophosphatase MutT (NUDIX family)